MSDQDLMELIKSKFAGELADVGMNSNVPTPFLAALVANESGGDPLAKRFEGSVLVSLWKVILGRTQTFGVFRAVDLIKHIAGVSSTVMPQVVPVNVFNRLDDLATSWGLTQIMGYHSLEKNTRCPVLPADLQTPAKSLAETVRLLTEFAERFQLDTSADFEKLLRCWNGGHPDAQTFDPQYVPNGLARMQIYASL